MKIYTQEQLEAMSNVQIDAIIFERKFGVIGSDKDMQRVWNSKKISYCNNWSDMGPLIFNNKIELSPLDNGEWAAIGNVGFHSDGEPDYKDSIESLYKSPLRAAAIVYILIKQGESK